MTLTAYAHAYISRNDDSPLPPVVTLLALVCAELCGYHDPGTPIRCVSTCTKQIGLVDVQFESDVRYPRY